MLGNGDFIGLKYISGNKQRVSNKLSPKLKLRVGMFANWLRALQQAPAAVYKEQASVMNTNLWMQTIRQRQLKQTVYDQQALAQAQDMTRNLWTQTVQQQRVQRDLSARGLNS